MSVTAAVFDGDLNDYDISSANLGPYYEGTLEVWFKLTGDVDSARTDTIAGIGSGTLGTEYTTGEYWVASKGLSITSTIADGVWTVAAGGNKYSGTDGTQLEAAAGFATLSLATADDWHHVAVLWKGSTLTAVVDGVERETTTTLALTAPIVSGSSRLILGGGITNLYITGSYHHAGFVGQYTGRLALASLQSVRRTVTWAQQKYAARSDFDFPG